MYKFINGISFSHQFPSKELLVEAIKKFVKVNADIQREAVNIKSTKIGAFDGQYEILHNMTWRKFIGNMPRSEEKTFLLSLIVNSERQQNDYDVMYILEGSEIKLPKDIIDNVLLSLASSDIYKSYLILGRCNRVDVALKNITEQEHIEIHRAILGIRKYHANDVKHKTDRENYYGNGRVASRMDLNNDEAQQVLREAIEIDGKLYAEYKGKYYAFQCERDVVYHGYRVDDLAEHIRRKLM